MPLRLVASALLPVLAAVFIGAVVAVDPAVVRADCQPAGPIGDELRIAEVAFVGTAVQTRGPVARFAVTEVWAGDVAREVEVRGLSDLPARPGEPARLPAIEIGEDDRTWEAGVTYLVVPFVDGAILRDHLCTPTIPWVPELAELRPADARILEAESAAGKGLPTPVIVILGAVAAVAVISAFGFRRDAKPRRSTESRDGGTPG